MTSIMLWLSSILIAFLAGLLGIIVSAVTQCIWGLVISSVGFLFAGVYVLKKRKGITDENEFKMQAHFVFAAVVYIGFGALLFCWVISDLLKNLI